MEDYIKMATEEKEPELRMEGKIIGITEKGAGKYRLELMLSGNELPSPLWVNTTEAGGGKPKVKGGAELRIDDYVIASYVNSKPYMSHGKETISRWVKGVIEVVDQELIKGKPKKPETLDEYPTMQDSPTMTVAKPRPELTYPEGNTSSSGFSQASNIPAGRDLVSEGALIIGRCLQAVEDNLRHKPILDQEIGLVRDLFKYVAWSSNMPK
jgi:hypothetical protein